MGLYVCLFAVPLAALAQGPDFSGLPANAGSQDLAALVQTLVRRVAELERRVDALETAQARTLTDDKPKADPEAARLLAVALTEKEKLIKHLDEIPRLDRKDPRIQSSRVKPKENWDTVVADAKRFADALKAAVGRASGLEPSGKASLEGLIKWARGRSVYQSNLYLNATEHLILPVDFATDLVPHESR